MNEVTLADAHFAETEKTLLFVWDARQRAEPAETKDREPVAT
jgi:hypothetical protein